MRQALDTTVRECRIVASGIARRSPVTGAAISRYRAGHRDLVTRSLDQILQTFSVRQYSHFIDVLAGEGGEIDLLIEDSIRSIEPLLHPENKERSSRCLESGILRSIVFNFTKSCSTEQFHELLCTVTSTGRGESTPLELSHMASLAFYPARPSLRDAFNILIDDHGLKLDDLQRRSGIPASAISGYKMYGRDVTTKSLDQLLGTLTKEEYVYFLSILKGGQRLLETVDPAMADERLQDDLDFQYKVFNDLMSNIAQYCDTEQYEDLLCLMSDGLRAGSL